jgi:hypothetical protein
MITGIDVVFIHTPHPELGDWYAETLGLSKGYGDDHWQEYRLSSGSRFALDFTAYPRSAVEKQAMMISFRVEDIHAAVRALSEKGVRFYPANESTVFDVGPSLVATFQDPDGNWVQLSQPKPFE